MIKKGGQREERIQKGTGDHPQRQTDHFMKLLGQISSFNNQNLNAYFPIQPLT